MCNSKRIIAIMIVNLLVLSYRDHSLTMALTGRCNECFSNGIACLNEENFAVCIDNTPTAVSTPCKAGAVCTAEQGICLATADGAVPVCYEDQCGTCTSPKRNFACLDENMYALCFDGQTPALSSIDSCPQGYVCDLKSSDVCSPSQTTIPSCIPAATSTTSTTTTDTTTGSTTETTIDTTTDITTGTTTETIVDTTSDTSTVSTTTSTTELTTDTTTAATASITSTKTQMTTDFTTDIPTHTTTDSTSILSSTITPASTATLTTDSTTELITDTPTDIITDTTTAATTDTTTVPTTDTTTTASTIDLSTHSSTDATIATSSSTRPTTTDSTTTPTTADGTTTSAATTTHAPRDPNTFCAEIKKKGNFRADGDTTCAIYINCYLLSGQYLGWKYTCRHYFNAATGLCQTERPADC